MTEASLGWQRETPEPLYGLTIRIFCTDQQSLLKHCGKQYSECLGCDIVHYMI